jgi:hypothetical protein
MSVSFVVLNWMGCTALFLGYILLTLPKENKRLGVILTMLGQVLVGIWAVYAKAMPIYLMEVAFMITSLIQLYRLRKK